MKYVLPRMQVYLTIVKYTCILGRTYLIGIIIIPRALMGFDSIAHEAEGRMGY